MNTNRPPQVTLSPRPTAEPGELTAALAAIARMVFDTPPDVRPCPDPATTVAAPGERRN